MSKAHLSIYLNDHLAGAVAVLDLLEHLAKAYEGSEIEPFVLQLHEEIAADRKELERLMADLEISQSATRKTAAWLGEKVAELKLRIDDPKAGSPRLLEALDAVSTGVEGKRLLWRAIAAAAENEPRLRKLDYDHLTRRAEDQRQRVEVARLAAAREALKQ